MPLDKKLAAAAVTFGGIKKKKIKRLPLETDARTRHKHSEFKKTDAIEFIIT